MRFSRFFIDHLLTRTLRIEEDLVDLLFNSSERRLARTLLLLANFDKGGIAEPIIGKISQETLAGIVGTTRSRISQFMNKFRRLGLIDYNGLITVYPKLLYVVRESRDGRNLFTPRKVREAEDLHSVSGLNY